MPRIYNFDNRAEINAYVWAVLDKQGRFKGYVSYAIKTFPERRLNCITRDTMGQPSMTLGLHVKVVTLKKKTSF